MRAKSALNNDERMNSLNSIQVIYERAKYSEQNAPLSKEKNVLYVDSNFLNVFTFPLLEGDPKKALSEPDHVLITENLALKYFGTKQNVVGKIIQVNGAAKDGDYVISGIIKNPPKHTHLAFSALFNLESLERLLKTSAFKDKDSWNWPFFDTYVLLSPNS